MKKKIFKIIYLSNTISLLLILISYKLEIKSSEYNDLDYNNDIVGNIKIDNKSYNLLQTNNNTFYLYHDYNKKIKAGGSIFIDYRCDLVSSKNCFIYGHSSTTINLPFNSLLKFLDETYLEQNKYVYIKYKNYDLTYEIIGITDNYNTIGNYLYIQTCNLKDSKLLILVLKKYEI